LAVLLLPHPLIHWLANVIASRMFPALLCHLIPTVSPTFARSASDWLLLRYCFPKLFQKSQ
jgi:hypothetical protein